MNNKKSLGQNFLKDPKILSKIADFAHIEPSDTIIEIGPGEGVLTQFLLKKAANVISIEKDERLIPILNNRFRDEIENGSLNIIEGDILDLEAISYKLEALNSYKSYKLIGNIPYYITGAIFEKFLENPPYGHQPESITFVIQKEVADRIIAREGKESILSISIKVFGEPEYGGLIKAGSFVPAPKVDSAILSIRNISKSRLRGIESKKFFKILRAGFSHKRKKLISNLVSEKIANKDKMEDIFKKNKIGEKVRAEDLKVENWVSISKEIT